MKVTAKRAEYLSIAGIVISILFFAISWLVGGFNGILAAKYLAWQILGGSIIWLYMAILFHNRGLAEQEKRDAAMLSQSAGGSESLFQSSEQRQALFSVAQKRLEFFEKWFTPAFAGLIGAYCFVIGLLLYKGASDAGDLTVKNPLPSACILAAVAFFSFLISKYATGMSSEEYWKPLRAAGSYLVLGAVISGTVCISLAMSFFQYKQFTAIMAWVVPCVMFLIGSETLLNILLDIYRPRIKGQYHRPPFDSRILAIINEPGGILHTAASTLDYQFGFKVSQTWFYQLLEKAIMPLLLFAIIAMYLLSCFVVVNPGQKAVIEHFGSFENGGRIVGPGLNFKWPWPIDIAYVHDTELIHQIEIGYQEKGDTAEEYQISRKPLLWGEKHYEYEYKLLVAAEVDEATQKESDAPPVSIVIAAVPVQYKIKDLKDYVYNHAEPQKLLEDICYRELVRYALSSKIETETFSEKGSDMESILGAGRSNAAKVLTQRIQGKADELKLGVDIVMVGLQGVHPPVEVAEDYRMVISSVQQRQAEIFNAIADKNQKLAELAGSIEGVDELIKLVQEYQAKKDTSDQAEIDSITAKLDAAFSSASGEVYKVLAEANSYKFEKGTIAKATGERFASQLKAFNAAPEIYKQEMRLSMLEAALKNVRKYVVVSDDSDSEVMIIDLQEKLTPSLYELEVPEGNQ